MTTNAAPKPPEREFSDPYHSLISESISRDRDLFGIPQAGFEMEKLASQASIDVILNAGSLNADEFVTESTAGLVEVYGIYQALLTVLHTVAQRKRGTISRALQNWMFVNTV